MTSRIKWQGNRIRSWPVHWAGPGLPPRKLGPGVHPLWCGTVVTVAKFDAKVRVASEASEVTCRHCLHLLAGEVAQALSPPEPNSGWTVTGTGRWPQAPIMQPLKPEHLRGRYSSNHYTVIYDDPKKPKPR